MTCRCPNCGADVTEVVMQPNPIDEYDPSLNIGMHPSRYPTRHTLREKAKDADRRFIYAESMKVADKGRRKEVRKMWYTFHDLKYGPGGRKECGAQYDPSRYPWENIDVRLWWAANMPDWFDAAS